MKILHLLSNLGLGGAEMHTYNIVKHYPPGHEHMIAYLHDGPLRSKFEALGVTCYKFSRWITFISHIKLIRHYKPDVIHAVLWPDVFWGKITSWITGVRLVPFVHYNAKTLDNGPSLRSSIDRITVNLFPARYHAVSKSAAEAFLQTIIAPSVTWPFITTKPTVDVINNGLNLHEFAHNSSERHRLRTMLGIPDNAVVIGTVGRCIKLKRFDWLIDRFIELCKNSTNPKSLYLVIIGDGPERAALHKAREQTVFKDNIILPGYQLPSAPWYSVFDSFAISSQSEAHPIALLEACAAGLPTVMSCAQLPDDTLSDGIDGFTVLWNDKKLFEQRLSQLITNQELRTTLGKNALTTAQSYDITTIAQKYHANFSAQETP